MHAPIRYRAELESIHGSITGTALADAFLAELRAKLETEDEPDAAALSADAADVLGCPADCAAWLADARIAPATEPPPPGYVAQGRLLLFFDSCLSWTLGLLQVLLLVLRKLLLLLLLLLSLGVMMLLPISSTTLRFHHLCVFQDGAHPQRHALMRDAHVCTTRTSFVPALAKPLWLQIP